MWSGPEVPLHGESELELAEIRDDISENYKDSIIPIHYNFYNQPLKMLFAV